MGLSDIVLPSQLIESYLFGSTRFSFLVTSFILVRGSYQYFYVFLMASFVFEHRIVRVRIMRFVVVELGCIVSAPSPEAPGTWWLT